MKWNYKFNEIASGYITIKSKTEPAHEEIIEEILKGNATYHNTDWEDIILDKKEE